MNAENSGVDDSSKSEIVKNFCAIAPNINRSILSKTLVVEPVYLCDLP